MDELISVTKARELILAYFSPTAPIRLPISKAHQYVLAEDVYAGEELPPFTNSSMDGYAVIATDTVGAETDKPVTLEVIGDLPAGSLPQDMITHGKAIRVMTGAMIPDGCDAVVPLEFTRAIEQQPGSNLPKRIRIFQPVRKGDFLRPHGQDVAAGELILPKGHRLRAQDIGILAMMGVSEISVFRKPEVGLFSSGDELLPVGTPRLPGKIYDANTPMLSSLIVKYGGEVNELGIIPDQSDAVQSALENAVSKRVDLILSSAGVSVGAFDYVRKVVESQGELGFWRVNMRPGKPLLVGRYQQIPFIGLPGNPVSAFVGFEVFIRPALLKMQGQTEQSRPFVHAILDEPVESDGRESYLRAQVWNENGHWQARLTGHQGSGNLLSLVRANALLLVPSGVKYLPIGSKVDAWLLSD